MLLLVQIKSRQLVMDDSSSMHVNSKGSTSYQEGRIAASTVLTLIMAFIEWRQLRLATPIAKKE